MKQANRYKRMLLKQRRMGVESLDQVKPDPYYIERVLESYRALGRLVTYYIVNGQGSK